MTTDSIVDKVRKLLALAASANEHEAALAAERAQSLLAKHNLSMSDVETKSNKIGIGDSIVTNSYAWRRWIGAGVGELYFSKYFYTRFTRGKTVYDHHSFVGEEQNVIVAKLMFEYLVKTVDRMAREGARLVPQEERSSYRTTFRDKCARRLNQRMAVRIAQSKAAPTVELIAKDNLPALQSLYEQSAAAVDSWVDEQMGPNAITVKKQRGFNKHGQGARDGERAGNQIGLDRQVGENGPQARLT